MTAIKHALQRDIFTPNDERLLSIVNVCKAGKKKRNCFLCATGILEYHAVFLVFTFVFYLVAFILALCTILFLDLCERCFPLGAFLSKWRKLPVACTSIITSFKKRNKAHYFYLQI